jgi:AraC family transcriptional regulator, transcriptional activator of pobA
MKVQAMVTVHILSITQQHQLLGLVKPKHPLFSLLRFEDFSRSEIEQRTKLISDLYQITLKKDCPCKLRYGQTPYDFDEGVMSFMAPKQVNMLEPGSFLPTTGWWLAIHPDFLRKHPVYQKIKSYSFFDYAINEALILSAEEQQSVETIVAQIEKEMNLPIDNFSQDVILANLDLLLTYCNRYYTRQFITRKPTSNELLGRVESILNESFSKAAAENKLPTVSDLASKLHLSPKYLSDCLKQLTGQTAQQLIHDKLIEKAKEKLTTTALSVSEIAYQFGYEFPQSFSKLFKAKTNLSPSEFRHSFH